MDRTPLFPDRVDAVVFDVIGTLVDEDATWARVADEIAAEAGLASATELRRRREGNLDARMSAVVRGDAPWQPHAELMGAAAVEAVAGLGGDPTPGIRARAARSDREHRAWPDVPEATAALRRERLVAGLSNGDLAALARLAHAEAIAWDAILSSGSVRTFKPAPAAYRHAIDALDLDPARTLFLAAHPWDLRAASAHGFRTAYVARPGAERPGAGDLVDLEVADLGELVRALA
ncbi:haloacid dehalogenase type II [Clavibacter sepedonicus]|uniref:Haloacid dehalogenase n=1 Tax=Clavibacter sepedonicus TaxID=31964 RepID=B0RGE5_CLASE|nr:MULTISPECIES: haloacid dehalogenase type II [Clavibacter]MBD5381168.1 haloacid dehalogenase type II [Clavibacter sp.]OQJ46950.1 haloacid dehalogenase, type II [Clavibacter sepedonicus]OQJ55136.1 haloacid dehalogenase, type II [Clavibacter sepedonicus]UUK66478.1 haloacid dehalogenase type II [Clavibacter sepedonicus]CAQ01201.1 putative haloacid dehalogenase [Clavibacter sepedonicus]